MMYTDRIKVHREANGYTVVTVSRWSEDRTVRASFAQRARFDEISGQPMIEEAHSKALAGVTHAYESLTGESDG